MSDTMTASQYTIYQDALRALAGHDTDHARTQNDIGFNRVDGPMGHVLAERPIEEWSTTNYRQAHRILRRYARTQLPGLGFDFGTFPEPPEKIDNPYRQESRTTNRQAGFARISTSEDHQFAYLEWGGSDPLFSRRVNDMKLRLVSARFEKETKRWRVPLNVQNITSLAAILAEYATSALPYEETPDLRDIMAERIETAERNLEQSVSQEADIAEIRTTGLRQPEKLRPFQIRGIAFAGKHKQTIIADDMGLGKTLESIATVTTNDAIPALVICPATLRLNWKREIEQWVEGDPLIQVADGTKPKPIEPGVDFFIINYDVLHAWIDTIALFDWEAVILDESHYVKSKDARRSKAVAKIIKLTRPRYRLLLTGTPVLNRPAELWFPLSLIGGQEEFGGWWTFAERYCDPQESRFGTDFSGAANLNELNMRLRSAGKMIRRRKTDVLDELPDENWLARTLPMEGKGLRDYERAETDLFRFLKEEYGKTYLSDDGAALLLISTLRQLSWQAKEKAAYDWIDEFLLTDKKLILFGWHRDVVQGIAARYGAPVIAGGMRAKDIEAGKTRFQDDPECRLIVCNIAAGGVGHTLTAASDVAFVEFAWNKTLMDQALSRAHRMGQRESVTGWLLTGARSSGEPTIDDYMTDMIAAKGSITKEATDGLGAQSQRAMIERMRTILERQEREQWTSDM